MLGYRRNWRREPVPEPAPSSSPCSEGDRVPALPSAQRRTAGCHILGPSLGSSPTLCPHPARPHRCFLESHSFWPSQVQVVPPSTPQHPPAPPNHRPRPSPQCRLALEQRPVVDEAEGLLYRATCRRASPFHFMHMLCSGALAAMVPPE